MNLPAGWAPHPNPQYAATYAYEVANPSNMKPIAELQQQAQALPQQAAPGGLPAQDLNGFNPETWAQGSEKQERSTRGFSTREKNYIWLNFEQTKAIGQESHLYVRFLGDKRNDRNQQGMSVLQARHRVLSDYVPGDDRTGKTVFVPCFNTTPTEFVRGGPQNCPFEKAIDLLKNASNIAGTAEMAESMKLRVKHIWQCINLDDLQSHYVQETDEHGNPIVDATGQPVYKLVPAFVAAGKKLNDKLSGIMLNQGAPFISYSHGAPIRLVKRQTGHHEMQVDYDAYKQESCPVDPSLYPIIHNMVDLEEEILNFWERPKMEETCENILRSFGLSLYSAPVQVAPTAPVGLPAPQPQALPTTPPGVGAALPSQHIPPPNVPHNVPAPGGASFTPPVAPAVPQPAQFGSPPAAPPLPHPTGPGFPGALPPAAAPGLPPAPPAAPPVPASPGPVMHPPAPAGPPPGPGMPAASGSPATQAAFALPQLDAPPAAQPGPGIPPEQWENGDVPF